MFSKELIISNNSFIDYLGYFRVNDANYEFTLPSTWEPYAEYPSTLKCLRAKILAQFLLDYGHELLCASRRDQPILTAPQVMAQLLAIFRAKHNIEHVVRSAYSVGYGECDAAAKYKVRISAYLGANASLTAVLPLILSAGFTPVSVPGSTVSNECDIDHFSCDHCKAYMSVEMVTKLAQDDVCATLIERHLQQNPKCKSLDKLKRECILPEFFLPADRHSESKRKLQAALRDRLSRRTKFVKSLQDKPEFTVMPPPGDPTVNVFNPWTGTDFDQVCWNSLVPSCTYGLA